jgi:hypothetical protein
VHEEREEAWCSSLLRCSTLPVFIDPISADSITAGDGSKGFAGECFVLECYNPAFFVLQQEMYSRLSSLLLIGGMTAFFKWMLRRTENSTQRFKGSRVQRALCRSAFEPLFL